MGGKPPQMDKCPLFTPCLLHMKSNEWVMSLSMGRKQWSGARVFLSNHNNNKWRHNGLLVLHGRGHLCLNPPPLLSSGPWPGFLLCLDLAIVDCLCKSAGLAAFTLDLLLWGFVQIPLPGPKEMSDACTEVVLGELYPTSILSQSAVSLTAFDLI